MNLSPLDPTGDERERLDARWKRFALAVLNDNRAEILAAFADAAQGGPWTLGQMLVESVSAVLVRSIGELGIDRVRTDLEVGVLEHMLSMQIENDLGRL